MHVLLGDVILVQPDAYAQVAYKVAWAVLALIQGPDGGAKSQVTAEMREAAVVQVLADNTALWVALSGVQRGPDGRCSVRQDEHPALTVAVYVQSVSVRRGLEDGADAAVTTSRR